jgi:sulfite reductase (NADPH) hemoprotein beta-component
MACPALPTCGLALAESERFLPELMTRMEGMLGELSLGLTNLEFIVTRVTGCPKRLSAALSWPNSGLWARRPGRYQIYLGGNASSTRLNRLYRDSVKDQEHR